MVVNWPGWRVVWSPAPPLPGRIAGPLIAQRALAVCLLFVGLAGLAAAVSDTGPDRVRGAEVGAAAVALMLLSWFVLPRLAGWLVNVVALIGGLLLCHLAATSADPQIRALVPMLLSWLVVWNAYFLHPVAMAAQVFALLVGYAAALWVNPQAVGWPGFVVVAVSMMGTAVVVNAATRGLRLGATHDPLTGCWNRAGLDMVAAHALSGALRRGESVTVAMIDLDGFKQFNDARGHRAGDHLLQRAAHAWREELRGQDILARIGGDEFALVMPGVAIGSAEEVMSRLAHDDDGLRWTWGVTNWGAGEDLVVVLERADREMYVQKRGRAGPGPGEGSLLA